MLYVACCILYRCTVKCTDITLLIACSFIHAQLLREMQDKKIVVSAVTYVAVIDAVLCSDDQLDTALDLYSEMKQV
jgi:hypothetical protein